VVFGRGWDAWPSGEVPYPLFVFAGLFAVAFFSPPAWPRCSERVDNERLVTKIYFPAVVIPLAAVRQRWSISFVAFGSPGGSSCSVMA